MQRFFKACLAAAAFSVAAAGCSGDEITKSATETETTVATDKTESTVVDQGEAGSGDTGSGDAESGDVSEAEVNENTLPEPDADQANPDVVPNIDPDVNATVQPLTYVTEASGDSVTAYKEPSTNSEQIKTFNNSGEKTLPFQVIGFDSRPAGWIQVLLPIRPNGATGWIQESELTQPKQSIYHLEVNRANHELIVYEKGEVLQTWSVAIGTGDTPTPVGSFYLAEVLQPPDPSGPYGTYAYTLSGYSEQLDEFNGGNGAIGIHGTNDPSSIGSDVSHGCVRLDNAAIETLVDNIGIPLGSPVYIT